MVLSARSGPHRDFIRASLHNRLAKARSASLARDARRWILHYSMRITFFTSSIFIARLALALGVAASGCAHVISLPPQATPAEIEPSGRAAKPPDCAMPVLRHEPLTDFRKVAIV